MIVPQEQSVENTSARKSLNLALYKNLYLIRRSEKRIVQDYHLDGMRTPMHMSMGSEAIASGVCCALGAEGQVFGTYRSHAIFLAKTENSDIFFAELYGKDTSPLKGKGGSMHLCLPEQGFMGTSAVVATGIPVAVGAAFANKVQGNDKIVATFFGDGAVDEGAFWESLNVACLMKIPVLFICEDNSLAVHTPLSLRRGYSSLTAIVEKFDCHVFEEGSTDVEVIYNLIRKAVSLMQDTQKPCLMQLKYYRYLQHVGIQEDFHIGYRSRDEFERWLRIDPIKIQRQKLLDLGVNAAQISALERSVDDRINASVEKAIKAPFADKGEILKGVFR